MVELQPSKLVTWVRSPSPAPDFFLSDGAGESEGPSGRGHGDCLFCIFSFAHVAQSVEHFLGKEEVSGSIPDMGSS